ncbi:MAG: hypothetical protein RLZ33_614 [Bacteroidota bacterium]|jgi:response regulator of citrate/malate metabolism
MNNKHPIVILEDDVFYGKLLKNFLLNQEFNSIQLYSDEEHCLENISMEPTLYLLDYHLAKGTGLDVMRTIMDKNPNARFIYISAQEYSSVAIKVMRCGAIDYIEKNRHVFYHLKNTLDKIHQHFSVA